MAGFYAFPGRFLGSRGFILRVKRHLSGPERSTLLNNPGITARALHANGATGAVQECTQGGVYREVHLP